MVDTDTGDTGDLTPPPPRGVSVCREMCPVQEELKEKRKGYSSRVFESGLFWAVNVTVVAAARGVKGRCVEGRGGRGAWVGRRGGGAENESR